MWLPGPLPVPKTQNLETQTLNLEIRFVNLEIRFSKPIFFSKYLSLGGVVGMCVARVIGGSIFSTSRKIKKWSRNGRHLVPFGR